MLDIEKKLKSDEFGDFREMTLNLLDVEAQKVKTELDSGLSPSDYKDNSEYLKALKISIDLLRNYKPSGEATDDFINELIGEFDDNLNWVLSQLGSYAMFNNNLSQAIVIYEGLSAVNEGNSTIKESLGLAYVYSGRFKEATSIYREHILISDPQNYGAKAFLGIALWQLNKKEEAKGLLKDAYKNGDANTRQVSGAYLETVVNAV